MNTTTAKQSVSKNCNWFVNPWVDILFCCGGLFWIFCYIQDSIINPASNPTLLNLPIFIVSGMNHIFDNAHTAATLMRVYKDKESYQKFSLYTKWLPLVLILTGIIAFYNSWLVPIFIKINILWLVFHYSTQTYNIALLYCNKYKYTLKPLEKITLWLFLYSSAFYALVLQLTLPGSNAKYSLHHSLPFWGPLPKFFLGSMSCLVNISIIVFIIAISFKIIIERKIFPFPVLFLIITGWAINKIGGITMWIYAPSIYHGSQYILVTTTYHLKDKLQDNSLVQISSFSPISLVLRYLGLIFIAGYFIYHGLPSILNQLGIEYTIAFAIVACIFNFHHYLTDSALWRLKGYPLK